MSVFLKIWLLLLVFALGKTEVVAENGGYSVSVSFSQNVPYVNGMVLLNNFKSSLKDASEILHDATGLHFSKVTFKIPSSWDVSEWNVTAENSVNLSNSKSDFLIDNANDVVFGKFPFAQQYGGCGTPGKQIIIPTDFFDEANPFPKGITLAREWLKYRYGVYDENGYHGDSLYPLYYLPPGSEPDEVKITDCTNEEVAYIFLDQEGMNCSTADKNLIDRLNSKECMFKPDDENPSNISSSMMYFQKDISDLKQICGKDPDHVHNSKSPNKHNALCNGQSIWDVVKRSSDFQTETNVEGYDDIEYTYVQESQPKVVVAWENTKQMKNKGTIILNAINKFMIDLPSGSKFNGFPFKTTIPPPDERDYTLQDLNGLEDKKRISGDIYSDFIKAEDADINLAISKALDVLSSTGSASETEGTIIIITKNSGNADEGLLQKLKETKVCIKLMFFSEEEITEEIQTYVSALPCGTLEELPMSDKDEDTFEKLFEAMETILPLTVDDRAIETVKTEYLSEESSITVQVDNTVETVTFWVFSGREAENFDLKFNGDKKATKSEKIGNVRALSYSPPQEGDIELSFPHDAEKMLTQVTATSKAGKYFSHEIVIYDTSEQDSTIQMPVIIYAFIRFGSYPVQNAQVIATIERPNDEDIVLELVDNGKGNPDITQNDGIYSRYFTKFSEKGEYSITLTVRSNTDLTTFGANENADFQSCCGSYVRNDNTPKLYKFSKTFKFASTFDARNGRPEDGYKPSRILDLRVDRVDDDKIVLKWTSPGEEADYGTAQAYEIKFFTSRDEALNNFESGKAVLNFTTSPKESGETEIFEINIGDFDEEGLHYIALKTHNPNKTSDLSNIIEVFVPSKEATDSPVTDEIEKETKKSGVNNKTVGLIVGLIVGVLVLAVIVYLTIYFLVIKPSRKEENKPKPTTREPKESENNTLNPINFIPATTIMEHHNEKTQAKMENKAPPIFREEDFQDKNSLQTNEGREGTSNNDQELENGNKTLKGGEALPPKSPKRTTFV